MHRREAAHQVGTGVKSWRERGTVALRRGHQCKATLRPTRALRLRVGWCVSERRYRPKRCAACPGRCCTLHTSTTISITFLCPLHANTDLLTLLRAFPYSQPPPPRPHVPQKPTTTTLSVYDMMDEGQPVAEAVLTDPQPPRDYNEVWRAEDDPNGEPLLQHENLTTEDDYLYDEIKSDNYETVQYQVEWIMRCKCGTVCEPERPIWCSHGLTAENSTVTRLELRNT